MRYALGTKAVLGQNLMQKIQKQGTFEALKFCNERAFALTDSMARLYNAQIKRVSDKPRNLSNRANKVELMHISSFKNIIASGATMTPIVKQFNNRVSFYYPITINSMCLQCHGQPIKEIQPKVLNALKTLYPDDKATGYSANEVRGIWSIHFDRVTD